MWLLGILLGGAAILVAIMAFPCFSSTNPTWGRAITDMRSLGTALESYKVDNGAYPAMRPARELVPDIPSDAPEARFNTIEWGRSTLMGLTTPVAFVTSLYPDPFSDFKGMPFVYHSDGHHFILISAGPNCDHDIDPTRDVDFAISQPSPRLVSLTYDSTNGTGSSGDYWRLDGYGSHMNLHLPVSQLPTRDPQKERGS